MGILWCSCSRRWYTKYSYLQWNCCPSPFLTYVSVPLSYRQFSHISLTSWQCTVKRSVGRITRRPCHTWIVSSSKYCVHDYFDHRANHWDATLLDGRVFRFNLSGLLPPLVASQLHVSSAACVYFKTVFIVESVCQSAYSVHLNLCFCVCVCSPESFCPVMPWRSTAEPASTSMRTTNPRSISQ